MILKLYTSSGLGFEGEYKYDVIVMLHSELIRVGALSLYTSTQYWMSGSAVVKFREKGGCQEMVMELLALAKTRLKTDFKDSIEGATKRYKISWYNNCCTLTM